MTAAPELATLHQWSPEVPYKNGTQATCARCWHMRVTSRHLGVFYRAPSGRYAGVVEPRCEKSKIALMVDQELRLDPGLDADLLAPDSIHADHNSEQYFMESDDDG